jgi:hypothetical protein
VADDDAGDDDGDRTGDAGGAKRVHGSSLSGRDDLEKK